MVEMCPQEDNSASTPPILFHFKRRTSNQAIFFMACLHQNPDWWKRAQLLLAGDVESNPGPMWYCAIGPQPLKLNLTTIDMIKAFYTVNIHQLIHKIHNTHIPTTIIKFLANYLKGRRQYTSYNNHTSKHTNIKAGIPQGGVLSPTLFNIYLLDIPLPKISSLNLITYADDITITSSHPNTNTATQTLLPYLNEIHTWTHNNNLQINPTKTTSTLMTPDPSEYNKPLNIQINNIPIPTTSNPTILGLTFDPKLHPHRQHHH